MKTKHFILVTLLSLSIFEINANDSIRVNQFVLKIYINGLYDYAESKTTPYPSIEEIKYKEESKKYEFGNLSFAFESLRNKFLSHEFELMPIKLTYTDILQTQVVENTNQTDIISGGKNTYIESYFRYQLNHYFTKNKIINPFLGLSSQIFYAYHKYNPSRPAMNEWTEHNLGIRFSIIPSISFCISENFAIDLNVPVCLYETRYNFAGDDDPMLVYEEHKSNKFIGEFFPKTINFRIGLLYKMK